MRGQIGQLMQQAQQMQEKMKRAQEEVAQMQVTGSAGGGLVSVVMSGAHEVRRVQIDRKLFADDPEMAEDLVAAATNDAVNKVAELNKEKMGGMADGLNLPPGMKLPF
ncbi:YbaB/EbfC family nucleoid-associated protein [Oleiagrimonas sp.]|jgi:DNA-binding YbaB/EbfC family protein|uniref:YbaB/EbfC family nucleoid-associated protein n=1 Tax=Oleiagrimonas sp. TaxID=2010330 RepID=UPI002617B5DB|nr:YbaB/EbfC family nucleoid-associated protein [Oleiagrimonas sp.]MDA3913191.1 YbaB/EbfC family nucleoid-associated protein [Oleiagrimonas sp.]